MTLPRVIPCLLLDGRGLVKTRAFRDPVYIGDPRNAFKIFNEREVDEIVLLDIAATRQRRGPDLALVREIVSEAFMPVAVGGGIAGVADARRLLAAGVEKVVVNSAALCRPRLVQELAEEFGSQSVVVCLDVRRGPHGAAEARVRGGAGLAALEALRLMQELGAGELILQSVDRDGSMAGYDLEMLAPLAGAAAVPTVALGGAGRLEHLREAVERGGASAVAAGSLFVFHGRQRGVLINYPDREILCQLFHTN